MDVKEPSRVTIGGRKLAYDEARPADPAAERGTILLLTGLASKRLGWARQLDVFGREYRTIAMDHRDTGGTAGVIDRWRQQWEKIMNVDDGRGKIGDHPGQPITGRARIWRTQRRRDLGPRAGDHIVADGP